MGSLYVLQVQLLLAKAAANAEDWPEVVELVQPLVAEGFVPAWPTAAAAACKGSASVRNDAVLRSLLAFSLAHCSTEEVTVNPAMRSLPHAWESRSDLL